MRKASVRFICKMLQGDNMAKWNVTCKCGCSEFKNVKNMYVVTSDMDDPHGELLLMGECVRCGNLISLI